MKRIAIIVVFILVPVVIVAGIFILLSSRHAGLAIKMPSSITSVKAPAPACGGRENIHQPFFGADENNPAVNKSRVYRYTKLKPDVIAFYTAFGTPYDERTICGIGKTSVPLIQWNPRTVSLPDIVSGKYDHYLQHYARNLARYQAPVMLSFGHEMNGTWYVWGNGHVKPAIFIAAWRRIHTEMHSAKNVIWLWNPNRLNGTVRSLEDWYPGDSYVDLIGLDGYYRGRLATFDGLFGSSLRELHRIAPHKPVILAETGVNPKNKLFAVQVNNLFKGAKRWGLTGVIWFDINAKQQWTMNVPRGKEIRKAICNADQNVCRNT